MQNPTHDKQAKEKKSAETLKKEAANKQLGKTPETQKSGVTPAKK
ncbi:hypothetical protein [Pseudoalteromonas mariniglutinosa]